MSYRRLSPGPGVCGRFSRRREAASSRAASNVVILTPIRHQAEQPFPHATNGSATRPTSARNRYSFPSLALANAFATATSRSNPSSRKLSSVCVWPSHLDAGRIRLSDRCARCSGHSTRRSLGDCFRSRPPLTRRNRMAAPSLKEHSPGGHNGPHLVRPCAKGNIGQRFLFVAIRLASTDDLVGEQTGEQSDTQARSSLKYPGLSPRFRLP